jgi:hypothetical protein
MCQCRAFGLIAVCFARAVMHVFRALRESSFCSVVGREGSFRYFHVVVGSAKRAS